MPSTPASRYVGYTVAAIFIDRDGVINRNRDDYVKSWEEFEFIPGVVEALARLAERGHSVFVVTNQSIIGRGIVGRQTVDEIHERMMEEIEKRGGRIEAVMVCPHQPRDGCSCRKPMPKLFVEVGRRWGINLEDAYLVGDFSTDLEAARAVGCTPILVRTGRGQRALRTMPPQLKKECLIVHNLARAADIIEERERNKNGGDDTFQGLQSRAGG